MLWSSWKLANNHENTDQVTPPPWGQSGSLPRKRQANERNIQCITYIISVGSGPYIYGNLNISWRCTKTHVGELLLDTVAWPFLKLQVDRKSFGDQDVEGRKIL
jgi:hypothetical protein